MDLAAMPLAAGVAASVMADRGDFLRIGRNSYVVIAAKGMEQAGSCQGEDQQQNKPALRRRRVATP